ncbi:MAG: MBL fold metallo-hydrolase [Anaerolinea sp.]|nr:MBL fold metallo-hydrolase [Anaerolinea sp.]
MMATEIVRDVYWLNGGSSNFYLCVEGDGLTLIDTGMPRRAQLVWDLLAQLGRPSADLTRILVTHADLDHAGSAAVIQEQSGAAVYAGTLAASLLTQGKPPTHMPRLVQFMLDHFLRYRALPAATITSFADGDVLPVLGGLHVLATPGHTLDHFSFYSPTLGVLFAGDALNTRNGRLQATPPSITADPDAARRSALRLLALAPAVIACGHGKPFIGHSADDVMSLFNELRQE